MNKLAIIAAAMLFSGSLYANSSVDNFVSATDGDNSHPSLYSNTDSTQSAPEIGSSTSGSVIDLFTDGIY